MNREDFPADWLTRSVSVYAAAGLFQISEQLLRAAMAQEDFFPAEGDKVQIGFALRIVETYVTRPEPKNEEQRMSRMRFER